MNVNIEYVNGTLWQLEIDSKNKVEQKIDYIYRNTLHEKWNLAKRPKEYKWLPEKYYGQGQDMFGILTHYANRF